MNTREITVDTGTLLTISTGRYLTDSFATMHAAADVLAGQPLFTHQFASERLADQLAAEAKRQHPWLADELLMDDFPNLDGLDRPTAEAKCREFVQSIADKHGTSHRLVTPPEVRHVPLTDGLEHLGANR